MHLESILLVQLAIDQFNFIVCVWNQFQFWSSDWICLKDQPSFSYYSLLFCRLIHYLLPCGTITVLFMTQVILQGDIHVTSNWSKWNNLLIALGDLWVSTKAIMWHCLLYWFILKVWVNILLKADNETDTVLLILTNRMRLNVVTHRPIPRANWDTL